ncbi:MAG TPA: hypothetical protein VGG94_02815, partial [Chthoniobacterales bacterium]
WLALLDYVQGSGRAVTSAAAHRQWVVPLAAMPGFILPCWTVSWTEFSTLYVPHGATELAGGLVPPVAILAGLIREGRVFVRRIRWDLFLLVALLLVSMLPSAGVFRWSFRWLPLIHLIMALCAAGALLPEAATERRAIFARSSGFIGLLLVAGCVVAMQFFHMGGQNAFPFAWILLGLAGVWAATDFWPRKFPGRGWLPAAMVFAVLLATYLCIPTNSAVPKFNFPQELTKPAPLDPQRLYLAVYSPAEYVYRRKYNDGPVGQVARPGSTPMWAALRFINGYSPILPAGVAREFSLAIHGEMDAGVGDYLVRSQAGRAGILEQLGVDGLVIPPEIGVEPPSAEWELVFANAEGRVFHHRGPPLPTVRSVNWIDSLPDEEFATTEVSGIDDSRNSVQAEVKVPSDGRPALLTFSRTYFRGYEARVGETKLVTASYRGLLPTVEIPAGTRGRVILRYRPWWLVAGGAIAFLSLIILLSATIAAALRAGKLRPPG